MATGTFDYSSRDFQNIKQDLLRRATLVAPEWTDRNPSDFGMLLVDLWAYMGDVLHYYVDFAARESFIDTATQRESVLAFANLFDYTPNYRQASTATVYLANSGSTDVEIASGTEFLATYDSKVYTFTSTSTTTVLAGTTQALGVTEGEVIYEEVLTSSASGSIGQRYTLRSEDIVPSSVRLFVYEDPSNPEEWQRFESLANVGVGVGAFTIYVNANEETQVVLGSLLNGRVPPAGTKITATYRTSTGASGNIPANYITTFKALTPSSISIQSSTPATGGQDGESVQSIKRSVQTVNRTQNRAVTLTDFADEAQRILGISKSVAEYDGATSTVTVHAVPYVGDYLTTTNHVIDVPSSLQTAIVDTLQPLAMVGITVEAATTVQLLHADIDLSINVLDSYVAPWVEADVVSSINELFTFDNVEFGSTVRIGDIYRQVLAVEGVEYAIVNSLEILDDADLAASVLPINLVRKGTVTIATTGGVSTT